MIVIVPLAVVCFTTLHCPLVHRLDVYACSLHPAVAMAHTQLCCLQGRFCWPCQLSPCQHLSSLRFWQSSAMPRVPDQARS